MTKNVHNPHFIDNNSQFVYYYTLKALVIKWSQEY